MCQVALLLVTQGDVPFDEAQLSKTAGGYTFIVSPSLDRVAYIDYAAQKLLVNDAVPAGPLSQVNPLFSPDGKHMATFGHEGNEKSKGLYIDGKLEKASVGWGGLANFTVWSPDSRLIAYDAANPGTHPMWDTVLIAGSRRFGPYGGVSRAVFSHDAKRIAFLVVEQDDSWWLVVDGKKSARYDVAGGVKPGDFAVSSEGKLLYASGTEGKRHVLHGDKKIGREYDEVNGLVLSPDGKRTAFRARTGKQWRVVVDGVEAPAYDYVRMVAFSPDAKRVGYLARAGKDAFAVVDGQKGPAFADVGYGASKSEDAKGFSVPDASLIFSRDSARVSYIASIDGKNWVVVAGDARSEPFSEVGGLVFNTDATKVAFWARTGSDGYFKEIWRKVVGYK
jgi:hypothetical protein